MRRAISYDADCMYYNKYAYVMCGDVSNFTFGCCSIVLFMSKWVSQKYQYESNKHQNPLSNPLKTLRIGTSRWLLSNKALESAVKLSRIVQDDGRQRHCEFH